MPADSAEIQVVWSAYPDSSGSNLHSWSKRLPHNLSCLVPCVRLLNPPMGANRNWVKIENRKCTSSLGTPFNSGTVDMYPQVRLSTLSYPELLPSLLAPILDW